MREVITIPLVVMVIAAVIYLWPRRPDTPPPKVIRLAELTFFAAMLVVLLSVSGKPLY